MLFARPDRPATTKSDRELEMNVHKLGHGSGALRAQAKAECSRALGRTSSQAWAPIING